MNEEEEKIDPLTHLPIREIRREDVKKTASFVTPLPSH